jgi:hypothetical protein
MEYVLGFFYMLECCIIRIILLDLERLSLLAVIHIEQSYTLVS